MISSGSEIWEVGRNGDIDPQIARPNSECRRIFESGKPSNRSERNKDRAFVMYTTQGWKDQMILLLLKKFENSAAVHQICLEHW
jgi:hypothetical protein